MNFQYLLPAQGNLKALELTERILSKIQAENQDDIEVKFSNDETAFLNKCVDILDQNNKLPFQCLPVIRKIKGEII